MIFNTFQMISEMMLGLKADLCATTWPGTNSSSSGNHRDGGYDTQQLDVKTIDVPGIRYSGSPYTGTYNAAGYGAGRAIPPQLSKFVEILVRMFVVRSSRGVHVVSGKTQEIPVLFGGYSNSVSSAIR